MMKPKKEVRYFNFPIAILRNDNTNEICEHAMQYSVWQKAKNIAEAMGYEVNSNDDISEQNFIQSLEWYGIKWQSNKAYTDFVADCEVLVNSITEPKVFVSINTNIIFKNRIKKLSAKEESTFRAFIGLKSILGKSVHTKSNTDHLTARMYGFDRADFSNEFLDFRVSNTRRKLSGAISELQKHWGLVYYSRYMRGFYFSFQMSIKDLVKVAELKRESYLQKQLKDKENLAYQEVMAEIKSNQK